MPRSLSLTLLCLLVATSVCWGVGLPPNTQIHITANADYVNAFNEPQSSEPAGVTLTVLQVVGVDIAWEPPDAEVMAGEVLYVPVRITNVGNGSDTFDLTVASTNGWVVDIVYDENADGIHQIDEQWVITDTSLVADGYCACFARLSVPDSATTADTLVVGATSRTAPADGSTEAQIPIAPPGQISTSLALGQSPADPIVNQQLSITGTLSPAMEAAVDVVVTTPAGLQVQSSHTTSADGTFTAHITPTQAGTHTVQASFAGTGSYTACNAALNISVRSTTLTAIVMQATPATPQVSSEVSLTGTLTPAMSVPITVVATPPAGDTVTIETTTDEFGRFTAATTVDVVGAWSFAASFSGNALYAPSNAELSMSVSEEAGAHSVSWESAPSANPTTVAWPESTQLSASATDSQGHQVRYEWSDGGAGGTFTPSASVANPVYLAAQNTTAQTRTLTLTCTASCAEEAGVGVVNSVELFVISDDGTAPRVKAVTPQSGVSLVGLTDEIVIAFTKPMNANSLAGSVTITPALAATTQSWDETGSVLTISHSTFAAGTLYTCTISTGARDAFGSGMASDYTWSFRTVSSVRFEPSDIGAVPSQTFATPGIIVSDPLAPANVSFRIGVPAGIIVSDAVDAEGSLACVKKGADAGTLFSEWDQASREIVVTATVPEPAPSVQIVKAISLSSSATAGTYELTAQGAPALTIRVRALVPGDFNGDGFVNIADAARFTQAWVRWQADPLPAWDEDIDAPYDLAPHTVGDWPAWTIIGDHVIDNQDATAFSEAWNAAHTTQSLGAAAKYVPMADYKLKTSLSESSTIAVTVEKAVDGIFEAVVAIPAGAGFDPALAATGGLANVAKGAGAGSLFFSEYDQQSRTVRITGSVRGKAPYKVASIAVSR